MKKISWLCAASAFFGVFLFSSSPALAQGSLTPPGAPAPTMKTLNQIEPRTPISGPLPVSISTPGSYYLTTNLTGISNADGITILTNDVYLDLNGFTLHGLSNSFNGIVIANSYTNISICNGTVKGWGEEGVNGFTYAFPRNVLMEHLTVSDNGSGGISAEATSIIRDCLAFNNVGDGIYSDGALIINCVARNNSVNGIQISGSTVHACVAHFNGSYGIYADNSTVMDCDILNNTTSGLYVGVMCHVVNNRIANHNGSPGNGLYVSGSYNVIANNSVLNNTYGIYCTSSGTNNAIVQNKFMGNPYSATSIYDIVPSVSINNASQAQNVTNANAWANFFW